MKYTKCKLYTGGDLVGRWEITTKLDGVRALVRENGVFSRAGKPLYNLDFLIRQAPMDVEIFVNSWEETITAIRSATKQFIVDPQHIYSLDPLDPRLLINTVLDPTEVHIKEQLQDALTRNHEGLVIRQGSKWLKVKPHETYDVRVTDIVEGTGKYKGMLGAFVTKMGNVGTGLVDIQRQEYFHKGMIGQIIEVKCMELTKDGKFRHPSFVRWREDKK